MHCCFINKDTFSCSFVQACQTKLSHAYVSLLSSRAPPLHVFCPWEGLLVWFWGGFSSCLWFLRAVETASASVFLMMDIWVSSLPVSFSHGEMPLLLLFQSPFPEEGLLLFLPPVSEERQFCRSYFSLLFQKRDAWSAPLLVSFPGGRKTGLPHCIGQPR